MDLIKLAIKILNKKVLDKKGEKNNEISPCYECKGFKYMRNECPNLNKEEENDKKKKKKGKGKRKKK